MALLLVAGLGLVGLIPAAASAPLDVGLRGQWGTLAVKPTANIGQLVKATATFTPRRRGRVVLLQVKAGTQWRKAAAGRESTGGSVVFGVPTSTPGRFAYRAVGAAFHGLAAIATGSRPITIIDTGQTTRASLVDATGAQSNSSGTDGLQNPVISADGRFVAFASNAANLVSVGTNGKWEVFLRDRYTGTTTLVSAAPDGTPGSATSMSPSISAGGRYIAYFSGATNIVPGAFPIGGAGVLVWDRLTGQTIRADVAPGGAAANDSASWPSISGNGRYVAFWSQATNLTPAGKPGLFFFDRVSHSTTQITVATGTYGEGPSVSGNGQYVTFASPSATVVSGDTNGVPDVFVWTRSTRSIRRVSVSATRRQANGGSSWPSISSDGRYIAYWTDASNLAGPSTCCIRALLWDRKTRRTIMIFPPGGLGDYTAISAKGNFVALVAGANQVYVWDRATRRTTRVSASPTHKPANEQCVYPTISGNGRYIAFSSIASNLVPGDTNSGWDVFVRDRFPG